MGTRGTASGRVFHLLAPANKAQDATADGRSASGLKSALSDGGRGREYDSVQLSAEQRALEASYGCAITSEV